MSSPEFVRSALVEVRAADGVSSQHRDPCVRLYGTQYGHASEIQLRAQLTMRNGRPSLRDFMIARASLDIDGLRALRAACTEQLAYHGQHEPTSEDDATQVVDASGRPNFAAMVLAIRGEIRWSASLHRDDKTGQAAGDQRALAELAQHIIAVAKRLGFGCDVPEGPKAAP